VFSLVASHTDADGPKSRGAVRLRARLFRGPALGGLLLVFLLASAETVARADIYRYVDERGVIHFSNVPNNPRYRLYLREARTDVTAYLRRFDGIIRRAAREHGVETSLIRAVIRAESDFDQLAVSKAGARGLMQLMPETAEQLAVDNPFDPEQNIHAGVRHLKGMLQQFGNDVPLALAAYNAGENAVRHYGRIPPFEETRRFIDKVLRYRNEFRLHEQEGS
jgi:soluble lytic murein transglycosylase